MTTVFRNRYGKRTGTGEAAISFSSTRWSKTSASWMRARSTFSRGRAGRRRGSTCRCSTVFFNGGRTCRTSRATRNGTTRHNSCRVRSGRYGWSHNEDRYRSQSRNNSRSSKRGTAFCSSTSGSNFSGTRNGYSSHTFGTFRGSDSKRIGSLSG